MSSATTLLTLIMTFAFLACLVLGLYFFKPTVCSSEVPCPDGRLCPAKWHCCAEGCCAPLATTPTTEREVRWYHVPWYSQWPVLFLLGTAGGVALCCLWCVLARKTHAWCLRRPDSEQDSAGSLYPPPRYSRCGSFHQAPPPYSEVTSKPELYPLVITCGEGENKNGGGNYLMVHYFRNCVIRAPGSLSATSTAESISSSFICNATNEANTIVPPPYSRASLEGYGIGGGGNEAGGGLGGGGGGGYGDNEGGGGGCGRSLLRSLSSLTDSRPARPRHTDTHTFRENLITSPVQPLHEPSFDLELELIDCEMYCDGGCKPRVGASPPAHCSPTDLDESERAALRGLFSSRSPERPGSCESPPQPTSPTQSSRDSTLRRTSDERRYRRFDTIKKTQRQRKTSLYMPLSLGYPSRNTRVSPGVRVSSRSAPVTPCGALVPNLFAFGQRVSSRHSSRSSKLEEEINPLINGENDGKDDPKF